jgi:hypothetical protein
MAGQARYNVIPASEPESPFKNNPDSLRVGVFFLFKT